MFQILLVKPFLHIPYKKNKTLHILAISISKLGNKKRKKWRDQTPLLLQRSFYQSPDSSPRNSAMAAPAKKIPLSTVLVFLPSHPSTFSPILGISISIAFSRYVLSTSSFFDQNLYNSMLFN